MAGLDLYFDFGPQGEYSRDDLYQRFVEYRDEYDSGLQSFAWSQGASGVYINRDQAFMTLRRMLRKLGELDGRDYGAGTGRIESIRIVPRDPYTLRRCLGYGLI